MADSSKHSGSSQPTDTKSVTETREQHYLVVSGEEYTYIQHSSGCPTEELGNDDGKYTIYRCDVAHHEDGLDLDEYFETKKLAPGKYPIEAWASKSWTDYGWEYDGGLTFAALDENDKPPQS
jgi:hypothetical protein